MRPTTNVHWTLVVSPCTGSPYVENYNKRSMNACCRSHLRSIVVIYDEKLWAPLRSPSTGFTIAPPAGAEQAWAQCYQGMGINPSCINWATICYRHIIKTDFSVEIPEIINTAEGTISFEVMGNPHNLPRQRFDSRKGGHFFTPRGRHWYNFAMWNLIVSTHVKEEV
jgi:hypothetical protein